MPLHSGASNPDSTSSQKHDVHLGPHDYFHPGQPQELLFPLSPIAPPNLSTTDTLASAETERAKYLQPGQEKPDVVIFSSHVSKQDQDACAWKPQTGTYILRPPRCQSFDATASADGHKECDILQLREQIRLSHEAARIGTSQGYNEAGPRNPSSPEMDHNTAKSAVLEACQEANSKLGSLWSSIQTFLPHQHYPVTHTDRFVRAGLEAKMQISSGYYIYSPQFGEIGYYLHRSYGGLKGHTFAVDAIPVTSSTTAGQVKHIISASANETLGSSVTHTPMFTTAPTPFTTPMFTSPLLTPTTTPWVAGSERPKRNHGEAPTSVMDRLKANLASLKHQKSRASVVEKASNSTSLESETLSLDEDYLAQIVKRVLLEMADYGELDSGSIEAHGKVPVSAVSGVRL